MVRDFYHAFATDWEPIIASRRDIAAKNWKAFGCEQFRVARFEMKNEGGNLTLQIYTEESRRLIGRDGETLEAIQFLLNRLLQAKDKDAGKVIVDCEHYRSMREDRVVQRVRELAARVRITGRSLQLEPMNSYERRLVHNAFKDDPDVATWSPSDSARIKQITLLKRQRKKETAQKG